MENEMEMGDGAHRAFFLKGVGVDTGVLPV
jgi:hypothetical protein